jgi:hypothetical protein
MEIIAWKPLNADVRAKAVPFDETQWLSRL